MIVARVEEGDDLGAEVALGRQLLEMLPRGVDRLVARGELGLLLAPMLGLAVVGRRRASGSRVGSIRPWPTSVTMMTPKVANRIRSRCGNGAPLSIVSGMASAAASDTTPRTPVKASDEHLLPGRRRIAPAQRRDQPARQIGRRKHPDEARHDHDGGGDRGRDQQFADREVVRLLDQGARLQAGDQEHEALDQIDDQVPEEDALQARRGRRSAAGRSSSRRARPRRSRARRSRRDARGSNRRDRASSATA